MGDTVWTEEQRRVWRARQRRLLVAARWWVHGCWFAGLTLFGMAVLWPTVHGRRAELAVVGLAVWLLGPAGSLVLDRWWWRRRAALRRGMGLPRER